MKPKFEILKPTCNLQTVFDGRGGIFTWVTKDDIKEFNMIYSKPGAVRGHHYHPEFTEYLLIVEGTGVMIFKDSEGKEQFIHMSKGMCTRAEPGISHVFHAITPVTAIAMLSKPWDDCKPPIIHDKVAEEKMKK